MSTLSCYHAVKRIKNTTENPKRPPVAPLYTDVAFVGDRSGSMFSTEGGSQTGACDYMKQQASSAKQLNCLIGFYIDFTTFDSTIENPYSGPAEEINEQVLTIMYNSMTPRGLTRLYDAVIDSVSRQIRRIEDKFDTLKPEVKGLVKDQSWLFAAACSPMTDGLDNQSAPGANKECQKILDDYQHNYSATALILAANQDAADLAEGLGLHREAALQMGTSGAECSAAMSSAAAAQFRSVTSGGTVSPTMFTQLERTLSCSQPMDVQSCPPSLANMPLLRRSIAGGSNVIIPPPPPPLTLRMAN